MATAAPGHTLTMGDQRVAITISDEKTEARLRALLEKRRQGAIAVRLAPVDSDVEGHAFGVALRSVALRVRIEDDDTEGHAISVHFPSVEDADRFRRNLLAVGVLAGTIALGSAGAIAISSQPATTGTAIPSQATQVYERPAGRGLLQGIDIVDESASPVSNVAAPSSALDEVTGKPARSGLQAGADIGGGAGAAVNPAPATERPAGSGPLEGVDR